MQTCSSSFSQRFLQHVGQVRQRLAGRQRLIHGCQETREAIEHRETVEADRFQPCVPAAVFCALPEGFAFAGERHVVLGPQQDQVIDDRRRRFQRMPA